MKASKVLAGVLAGTLLLSLCAGCGKTEEPEELPLGTAVETEEATEAPMSAAYSLTGKVQAVHSVAVLPLMAGEVTSLHVAEGDYVTEGQLLFTVDTSNVTGTLGALQQSYAATKEATDQSIANSRITVEQAELALENVRALFEVGAAAEQDVTRAEQGVEQAKIGLAAVEAQQTASLSQIQASMDQINTQVGLGRVTAPCSGLVTSMTLVKGGLASQAQPALMIAENNAVEVSVSVAEDVFAGVQQGDTVSVVVPMVSDEPLSGTVSAMPVAANQQTGLYDISITLDGDNAPTIGAFATVTFYTDRRDSTIAVPTEAVLTGDNDERYLFIVSGDKAKHVTVETGLVSDDRTEITSGLTAGDAVVVRGQSYLSDGDAVRVVARDGEKVTAPAAKEEE